MDNFFFNTVPVCTREGSGIEKVSRRIPKFITTSKSFTVNKGATIKLPCDVDQLGQFLIYLFPIGNRSLMLIYMFWLLF